MTDEDRRQQFLAKIKSQGRSSPAGKYWAEFHALLKYHGRTGGCDATNVPDPCGIRRIESTKLDRLAQQLRWAIDHECFAQAVAFLDRPYRGRTVEFWFVGRMGSRFILRP